MHTLTTSTYTFNLECLSHRSSKGCIWATHVCVLLLPPSCHTLMSTPYHVCHLVRDWSKVSKLHCHEWFHSPLQHTFCQECVTGGSHSKCAWCCMHDNSCFHYKSTSSLAPNGDTRTTVSMHSQKCSLDQWKGNAPHVWTYMHKTCASMSTHMLPAVLVYLSTDLYCRNECRLRDPSAGWAMAF